MALSIAQQLENIEIPPMPHTLHKVLQEMDRIAITAKNLEAIIKEDPALTARILKIANSPAYGVSGNIATVSHAIVILGFEEVKNLVIGLSLTQTFGMDMDFGEFSVKDLWMHSIGVANISMEIAKLVNGLDPEEFFIMGLLHDLGRILLCISFKKELGEILDLQESKKIPLNVAEDIYGLSHTEAGAYMVKKWRLSDKIVNAVRYHHHPKSAGNEERICAVIYLADQVCHKLGLGWASKWLPEKIKIPKSLSIPGKEIQRIAKRLREDKDAFEQRCAQAVGG